MCLAIVKTNKAVIPTEHLENGFMHNNDGAGFAYSDGCSIHIEKGFFTFDSFLARYNEIQPLVVGSMLVHFRFTTHGLTNSENCHPFPVGKRWALIHNGVIQDVPVIKDRSDTYGFVKAVVEPLLSQSPGSWNSRVNERLLESFIGRGNKVALINGKGQHWILNESAGMWLDGTWYSNEDFTVCGRYSAPWEDDYVGRVSIVGRDIPQARTLQSAIKMPDVNSPSIVLGTTEKPVELTGAQFYWSRISALCKEGFTHEEARMLVDLQDTHKCSLDRAIWLAVEFGNLSIDDLPAEEQIEQGQLALGREEAKFEQQQQDAQDEQDEADTQERLLREMEDELIEQGRMEAARARLEEVSAFTKRVLDPSQKSPVPVSAR